MKNSFILIILFFKFIAIFPHAITPGGTLQIGENMIELALAKILSLKYNLPLLYKPIKYSDLFVISDVETKLEDQKFDARIPVQTENDIKCELNNNAKNILFWTTIRTKIDSIESQHIQELKRVLQPKKIPLVNRIPTDQITIAVHIRKGNGGGEHYDGQVSSLQEFDFDRNRVKYLHNYNNYPFDWETYQRNSPVNLVDKVDSWFTKFPPNQYYIDQIKWLVNSVKEKKIYIQIFTDDKSPLDLLQNIKQHFNNPNITLHFENNTDYLFADRIIQDLYSMSRFDILIRSQSYFARLAELMGNHKLIVYPLKAHWEQKKLIMNTIVIKGSLNNID
jgi:hypothetical protein